MIDTAEKYLKERWEKQCIYYSDQSKLSKKEHLASQLFIAVGAILTPILLSYSTVPKTVPAVLSGLVAIATAFENVFRFGDKWRSYRQTLEMLKRERSLFEARAGQYRNSDAFSLFVEQTEKIISEEALGHFAVKRDTTAVNTI